MRNLIHHLQSLRQNPLPDKVKSFCSVRDNGKLVARKDWYGYRDYSPNEDRAVKVIHGSGGKTTKEVFAKIKPLLRKSQYSAIKFWYMYVDRFAFYNSRGETVTMDEDGKYNVVGRNYWRYRNEIWEENGYLYNSDYAICYTERHTPKTRFDARKHYAYQTHRRQSHKTRNQQTKRLGEIALCLINKPNIFGFYKSLFDRMKALDERERKYKEYLKKKESIPPEVRKKKPKSYIWDWQPEFTSEHKRERDNIIHDIKEIEGGNYTMYFQSSSYLYTLQKECHHAIPTPHLIAPLS